MRLRHKKWQEGMIEDNEDIALQELSDELISSITDLEIGSGRGQFLIDLAKKNPKRNYLGVEINRTAFAIAVKKLVNEEQKLTNVQYLNMPIDDVLPKLRLESLDNIYLNFSDPWPKKRHNRRRLTYPTRLMQYLNLLKKDGKILFKTDNPILFEASVEYFLSIEELKTSIDRDYQLTEDDCLTEYEKKFRERGVKICKIIAKKK